MLLESRGKPPAIVERRVELENSLSDIFNFYFELDRDETGRPKLSSMVVALDELRIGDREERRRIRSFWWIMARREAELRKARIEAEKAKASGKGSSGEPTSSAEGVARPARGAAGTRRSRKTLEGP